MITEVNIGEIDRSSDFNEQAFGFASSAKGFKILTSKLYENPPFSVIQELSANAYDSHVQAGCADKQFWVHLPTLIEPYFSIRDFGVSMNHEFMMTKYTLVFYSTKISDNDTNGAWGLGRLTGLACSDTYLVSTFLDGEKKTYNIFINEKGVPAIAHINTEETVEDNGVEVHIPVPDSKISEFIVSAEKIYRNYTLKPIFKGRNINLPEYTFSLKGDGWAIEAYSTQSMAIMGVYAYPIHSRSITGLTQKEEMILSSGFFFYYNIGDLDVTASRDGLSYEEKTCAALKKTFENIQKEFDKKIQDSFDSCGSIVEAYNLHYKYFNYRGSLVKHGRLVSNDFVPVWNGVSIKSHSLSFDKDVVIDSYSQTYSGKISQNKRIGTIHFSDTGSPKIYIKDSDSLSGVGIKKRIRSLLEGKANLSIFTIQFLTEEAKAKYYSDNNIDLFNFPLLSSVVVPKVPRTPSERNYTEKSFKKVFKFDCSKGHNKISDYWSIENVDLSSGTGYYVIIDRFCVSGLDEIKHPTALEGYMNEAAQIDPSLDNLPIYGIKVSQKDKIGPGWIPLKKHVETAIEAKIALLNIEGVYKNYLDYSNCVKDRFVKMIASIDLNSITLDNTTTLYKIIKEIEDLKKGYDEFLVFQNKLQSHLNNIKANVVSTGVSEKIKERLFNVYPMVEEISRIVDGYYYSVSWGNFAQHFIEYANLLKK